MVHEPIARIRRAPVSATLGPCPARVTSAGKAQRPSTQRARAPAARLVRARAARPPQRQVRRAQEPAVATEIASAAFSDRGLPPRASAALSRSNSAGARSLPSASRSHTSVTTAGATFGSKQSTPPAPSACIATISRTMPDAHLESCTERPTSCDTSARQRFPVPVGDVHDARRAGSRRTSRLDDRQRQLVSGEHACCSTGAPRTRPTRSPPGGAARSRRRAAAPAPVAARGSAPRRRPRPRPRPPGRTSPRSTPRARCPPRRPGTRPRNSSAATPVQRHLLRRTTGGRPHRSPGSRRTRRRRRPRGSAGARANNPASTAPRPSNGVMLIACTPRIAWQTTLAGTTAGGPATIARRSWISPSAPTKRRSAPNAAPGSRPTCRAPRCLRATPAPASPRTSSGNARCSTPASRSCRGRQEFGGRDASLWEWLIFEEEYYRAGAPQRVTQNGIFLLAPTIFEFGTPEQQARILPQDGVRASRPGARAGRSPTRAATSPASQSQRRARRCRRRLAAVGAEDVDDTRRVLHAPLRPVPQRPRRRAPPRAHVLPRRPRDARV